jgi:hypothetical protein
VRNIQPASPSLLRIAVWAFVALVMASPVQAAIIEIRLTGVDITYNGSSLFDGGSVSGGLANPADADPLDLVEFFVDSVLVGSLSSDISLDFLIPGVTGIPSAPGTSHAQTTPGNPGFFDLLIGTGPLASEFLLTNLGAVEVIYEDEGRTQFVSGKALAEVFFSNLPFGVLPGDTVWITFLAEIAAGTRTDNGQVITGFDATGRADISSVASVPEPSMLVFFGTSFAMWVGARRQAGRPTR